MYETCPNLENRETNYAHKTTRKGEFFRKLKRFFSEATTTSAALNQTNSLDDLLKKLI